MSASIRGTPARVAIIGAGWAGCAAAVRLAEAGVGVALFEQAPHLGGRARSVPIDDAMLDNGQHLLVGAYHATLDAIARVHDGKIDRLFHDLPLTIRPFGSSRTLTLVAADARAPWHFIGALLTARGLTLRERLALGREVQALAGTTAERDVTVRERFGHLPQPVYRGLLEPLCLAALNTPAARASSRVFVNVLRAVLTGPAQASRFLVPRVGLSELLPAAAARIITRHGGTVRTGERVRGLAMDEQGVALTTSSDRECFDQVIIAVGPHQVPSLEVRGVAGWERLRDAIVRLHYESINTIHLAYTRAPMHCVIERLDDAPGQWVFDGGAMSLRGETLRRLSVVISGNGAHDALTQPALIDAADAQLRRACTELGTLRYARVFAERRATYACEPGLARPAAGRLGARVHLAGDYAHPDLPATLESAVQTGNLAADAALEALRTSAAHPGLVNAS